MREGVFQQILHTYDITRQSILTGRQFNHIGA